MRDALAFLTVLPAGRRARPPGPAAVVAFPLVGVVIGGIWWAAAAVGLRWWGPLVAAALVLSVDLLVTGALHADALADEADGLACRRPPPEALAVMRQPAVGAVGAAVAVVALLMRFALLGVLLPGAGAALLAVPVAGRAAMVWTVARGQPVPGPSLAAAVGEAAHGGPAVASLAVAAACCAAAAGVRGLGGLAGACLVAAGNTAVARRRFGGVTGDVAGASGILGETLALAVLTAGS